MKRPVNLLMALVVAGLALWAALSLLGPKDPGLTATVRLENEVLLTLSLEEDQTLSLAEYGPRMEVEVADGRVRVVSSDCPDKVCVNTGWLGHTGQTAACLPNRVTVTVDGE